MAEEHQWFLDSGAELIAIAHVSVEDARDFATRRGISYPLLADPTHEVYDLYDVRSKTISLGQRPGLFVIDVEGIVRYSHVGRQQWEIPSSSEIMGTCRDARCHSAIGAGELGPAPEPPPPQRLT